MTKTEQIRSEITGDKPLAELFADLLQHAYGMEATIQKVNGNLTELADEYREKVESLSPGEMWKCKMLEDFICEIDETTKLMKRK